MRPQTKEASRYVDAVLKAVDMLDCFENAPSLSLKDILAQTGLIRSRAMRLAGTLESRGYLIQDPETGRYSLGSRLMALGRAFERHNSLISLTRPILKYLVKKTGESASLFVAEGQERVALVREEGTHAIRFAVTEGQRMPLYAGAAGKVLLAYGAPEVREKILASQKRRAYTSTTIADRRLLVEELDKIRQQGFAISAGERVQDSYAVAAPVFNHEGRLVGALGVAGPANRFEGQHFKDRLKLVLEAAQTLSLRLGRTARSGDLKV
jgi:DNA-binding IclR family transcriptional regulator